MPVRAATQADATLLAELVCDVQQLHVEALPHIYKPFTDLAPVVADMQQRVLADPKGHVFIAEADAGEAVGYIYATVVHRPGHVYVHPYTYLHIDVITVLPRYQGQGYGKALIEAVLAVARREGINRVTLDTLEFNKEAQAFFAAQGFQMYRHVMEMKLTKGS
jgi:GNAT superfamily N-acetyltransferase